MYGNITSHLYGFKRGPFIIEIPQQLFKGQRTLWPGNTHHLAQAVASEDKLVAVPRCPMPPAQGPCTHRAHGTGWAWLLGYVLHPTQPSARLGKQVEADGDVPLSFWQRRQAAQPFDAVTLWALAVCPAAGSAQGHSGGPACPSPHGPHRTIPPQWAVRVTTMPQSRHMQIRLMGCHSEESQRGSNHTHGFSPSAGGQEPEVTVAGWGLLRDRSRVCSWAVP